MRLHRLEMTAFGPFAGTEVVDFEALAEAGLFLLHGATGAGKTTVLDAVCFALFGRVPGSRGSGRSRLRSDHAPAGRESRVCLELTLADRRLEVSRSPEWQRPKRRGTGTTREPARTTVRELVGGEWIPRTTRNDEAAHLLHGLLGMGAEQFTKVVLLPQGEFAAFLRADAQERAEVLSRLFSIDVFTGVETWLGNERRRVGQLVELADRRTAELVSRADEAGLALPTTHDGHGWDAAAGRTIGVTVAGGVQSEDKPLRHVSELLDLAQVCARTAQADVERLEQVVGVARVRWDGASTIAERQERWTTASKRRQLLDESAHAHEQSRERLRWADLAQGLRPLVDTAQQARGAMSLADAALARACTGWEPYRDRTAIVRPALPTTTVLKERLSALAGEHALVARAAERLELRRQAEEELDRARARLADATDGLRAHDLRHEQDELLLRDLQASIASLSDTVGDVESAAAAVDHARSVHAHAMDLTGCDEKVRAAREAAAEAVDADQAAQQRLLDVRRRRLDGYAAELATGLATGQPCPVCGSDAHPAPASGERSTVDEADELRAEMQTRESAAARERAQAMVATLLAEQARLTALSEGLSPVQAEAALLAAEQELGRRREGRAALEAAIRRRDEVGQRSRQGMAARATLEVERDGASSAVALATGRLTMMDAELRRAVRGQAGQDGTGQDGTGHDGGDHDDGLGAGDPGVLPLDWRGVDDAGAGGSEAGGSEADRPAGERSEVAGTVATDPGVIGAGAADADLDETDLEVLVTGRLAALTDEREATAGLLTALEDRLAASSALQRCGEQLDRAARHSGLPDGTTVQAALLPADELEHLREAVREREAARAEVEAVLSDPVLQKASGEPAPDLPLLAEELRAATEQERQARASHAVIQVSLGALTRLYQQLSEHEERSDGVRQEYARVDELARCVEGTGGGNSLRMRLAGYVLAARLEQVAHAATERLDLMSGGRYALVHSDELTKGGGRSGLSLRVVDGWTGVERDTTTLSGGESFLASLALALGLADVVQQEAGGASIETLFVDEGFGTLDDETLDEVMDVLDDLRDGGRAVGVVSHVAELRQRIPAQVEVLKGRGGSTLVTHLP